MNPAKSQDPHKEIGFIERGKTKTGLNKIEMHMTSFSPSGPGHLLVMAWVSFQREVLLPGLVSCFVAENERVALFEGELQDAWAQQSAFGVLALLGFSKDLEACERLRLLCWGGRSQSRRRSSGAVRAPGRRVISPLPSHANARDCTCLCSRRYEGPCDWLWLMTEPLKPP